VWSQVCDGAVLDVLSRLWGAVVVGASVAGACMPQQVASTFPFVSAAFLIAPWVAASNASPSLFCCAESFCCGEFRFVAVWTVKGDLV